MATRNWQVRRLAAALGAEVTGVTLANADAAEAADIHRLLHEHMVLFFPGQFMSPEDQIAFGRHFGRLEGHPNLKDSTPKEHPELFRLVASRGGIADEWHTDVTFVDAYPKISVLRGVVIPPYGGDTVWSNTAAAYLDLPAPLRKLADVIGEAPVSTKAKSAIESAATDEPWSVPPPPQG